ncbi:Mss4-like protein [Biscogniauxia sp. FL1348]|nr:Mss4-like protein [Biscogniauxia sp. FL1348]
MRTRKKTKTMSTSTTASCLCGSVKLNIEGKPIRTNLCHCISCQKSTGSFCGAFAVYNLEQVTVMPPSDMLRTYEDTSPDSGGVIERSFCGRCGCPVIAQHRKSAEYMIVTIGVIDGPKDEYRPELELYCARRAPWFGAVEGSTTFEGMPTAPKPVASK